MAAIIPATKVYLVIMYFRWGKFTKFIFVSDKCQRYEALKMLSTEDTQVVEMHAYLCSPMVIWILSLYNPLRSAL